MRHEFGCEEDTSGQRMREGSIVDDEEMNEDEKGQSGRAAGRQERGGRAP